MLNSRSYKRISKKMKYAGMIINPSIFVYMRLVSSVILFVIFGLLLWKYTLIIL